MSADSHPNVVFFSGKITQRFSKIDFSRNAFEKSKDFSPFRKTMISKLTVNWVDSTQRPIWAKYDPHVDEYYCNKKLKETESQEGNDNPVKKLGIFKLQLTSTVLFQFPRKTELMRHQSIRMFHKSFIYPVHLSSVSMSACFKMYTQVLLL